CPKGKLEFELAGVYSNNDSIEFLKLLAVKFGLLARCFTAAKSINAAFSVFRNPLIDNGSRKSKGLYDSFGALSSFHTLYSPYADGFKAFAVNFSSIISFHARSITHVY
ncbi:hypothetical protein SAMN05660330_04213, partial [Desulforhopalus singaporensis]